MKHMHRLWDVLLSDPGDNPLRLGSMYLPEVTDAATAKQEAKKRFPAAKAVRRYNYHTERPWLWIAQEVKV